MGKVNVREVLFSVIFLLSIALTFSARALNTEVGQGTVLNSDHYPLLQGTFESFYGDGDLTVAASDRMLDWSSRKQRKTNNVQDKTGQSDDETRNSKSRSSREVSVPKVQQRRKEEPITELESVEVRSTEAPEKALTSREPSSSINFPGGSRSTKYKRKPLMTYYEKIRSRGTVTEDSLRDNASDAGVAKITVRNHEERSQKVKKRNRHRQKTMKLRTTTSIPTTWEYHTPQAHEIEKTTYITTEDLHNIDSKHMLTSEEQIESSYVATTTTTRKPRVRPTRRMTVPRKSSSARSNRGSVKFGDVIAKESGDFGTLISSTIEPELKSDATETSPIRAQSRIPEEDIPRINKQESQVVSKNDAQDEGEKVESRSRQSKKKEEKNRKNAKFEVFEDPSTEIRISDSYYTTHAPPSVSTTTSNVVYYEEPKVEKDIANKKLRKNQQPKTGNSGLYPLGNPYYPQGFVGFGPSPPPENRGNNGFFHPTIPYPGNQPQPYGYYFGPHPQPYDSRFGLNHGVPGFHHSPHVLSLRHSILESHKDPSTTSEPYSFTIPNFRIPNVDYNHKGCKTLLREVKEVPANQQNPPSFNGYQRDPRNVYSSRRFNPEVKSIVLTKECFFPEGVPDEAMQGRNAKVTDGSTSPIPIPLAAVVEEQQRETAKQIISERVPRPEKDSIKADKFLRRKQESRGRQGTESHYKFAPSEFHFSPPRYDPVRGYTFD